MKSRLMAASGLFLVSLTTLAAPTPTQAPTQVLFGDTHLHTSYSFDAFLNRNQSADPDTAYRWAKGQAVIHPYHRARVQINTPLDFLVVADHAEMMGVMRGLYTNTVELEPVGFLAGIKRWIAVKLLNRAVEEDLGLEFFGEFLPVSAQVPGSDPVQDPSNEIPDSAFGDLTKIETTAWEEIVDAAERNNDPGTFTSLIGWEWSSIPTGANLHRVVFTPDGADKAKQFLPFGSDEGQYPEELWQWLDDTKKRTGTRFVAIPHNSNISKGYMFAETTLKGKPITAEYARTRMQWEPVVEATQFKGDSEARAAFSPQDEFADFENFDHYLQQDVEAYEAKKGSFIRPALKTGLAIENKIGVNPFKFGMIGSTDSHTGLASPEEDNFMGKVARDSTPETKISEGKKVVTFNGWDMSASGLAAVWAKENTREAIYNAFQRKEVYATTGPRLKVQMFAGWNFEKGAANANNFAEIGYRQGIPMGGDLVKPENVTGKAPQFLIRAVKDPKGANLDRIQVIKGWVDSKGAQHEKVHNVAWAGERKLDAKGKLAPVGNTVDISIPSYTNTIGTAELSVKWRDPSFIASQNAFYYVRILQIPTPRHSQYDAVALQIDTPKEGPAFLQERAYTSPIWYTP